MSRREHWERVYETKDAASVSWFTPHVERSLAALRTFAPRGGALIDVGGGASTLVDDLLALGGWTVSVLDLSGAALAVARGRLGERERDVTWLVGDVTTVALPAATFDVWHDRAVLHFLTEAADREAYAGQAAHAVKIGGHAVISTFAPDGPLRCSGLDVVRYDAAAVAGLLGNGFALRDEWREVHRTPSGSEQAFMGCVLERVEA